MNDTIYAKYNVRTKTIKVPYMTLGDTDYPIAEVIYCLEDVLCNSSEDASYSNGNFVFEEDIEGWGEIYNYFVKEGIFREGNTNGYHKYFCIADGKTKYIRNFLEYLRRVCEMLKDEYHS